MKMMLKSRVILLLLIMPFLAVSQNLPGKLVNLGPQVKEKHLEGSLFLKDEKGKDWLYTVVRGSPGYLLGYDLVNYDLKVKLPLIKMDGAWDIGMSSDGWLYIAGSAGGRLARHRPGSQQIEDLGKPLISETYLFALASGKNGEIFGATYPGCRIFRYHPKDGFKDIGAGAIKAGEQYVHALAYHGKTDKLYAGIGSRSYLMEVNPRTGERKEILPDQYRGGSGFVYDMKIINDIDGTDLLLANLPDIGKTVVYNLKTETFEEDIQRSVMVKSAVKSPIDQKIYYSAGWTDLYALELRKPGSKPQKVAVAKKALATKWLNDSELLILNAAAELLRCNIKTGESKSIPIDVPAQPIGLIAVAAGPDGQIWTGGYLTGNNAAYNPKSKTITSYPGLHQPEGITVQDENIYFGTYTRAEFYVYNTTLPWSLEKGNPKKIGQIKGQDRPFGGVNVREHHQLYFGTVPGYGLLGGALAAYDVKEGKMTPYFNVMPNSSIVSLVYSNSLVIGGTSIWGGLGAVPIATEASLFGWDPVRKVKTFELVPVPEAKAITGLMNGPDGMVWGMADGVWFVFDPVSKTVRTSKKVFEVTAEVKKKPVWRDAFLVLHPSGVVYGTAGGKLFKIDPASKEITMIPLGVAAHSLSMDQQGKLYFRNGINLWQYEII